jgi:hypothetical protein
VEKMRKLLVYNTPFKNVSPSRRSDQQFKNLLIDFREWKSSRTKAKTSDGG